MASTGFRNGTDLVMSIEGTVVAYMTSNDFEVSMATRDVSNKGSQGWKESREGQKSWTASCEAKFAEDSSYGYSDLFSLWNSRGMIDIVLTTQVSGDKAYSGSAYITSLSQTNPMEDSSTFSVSLEGTGALTESTLT